MKKQSHTNKKTLPLGQIPGIGTKGGRNFLIFGVSFVIGMVGLWQVTRPDDITLRGAVFISTTTVVFLYITILARNIYARLTGRYVAIGGVGLTTIFSMSEAELTKYRLKQATLLENIVVITGWCLLAVFIIIAPIIDYFFPI